MSLLYPLGLLGLIGVPILIIIYIIKNKYTEQVVASTYLWTLSEKFLKRRNPINKIAGIISLILQILAVIFISFGIAHPVFIIPDAGISYCFILDGSASMQMEQGGKTRFEKGKDEIRTVIGDSYDGCTFTLVYAGQSTNIVYENTESKDQALKLLESTEPSDMSTGFKDALNIAQGFFDVNSSLKIYLVTDKSFNQLDNITLVNVSSGEENYALAVDGEPDYVNGTATVKCSVVSYESDASLTVELYADIINENGKTVSSKIDTEEIEVKKLEPQELTLQGETGDYKSLRAVIADKDALAADNEVVLFSVENENSYSALLVSEEPFFINAIFSATRNININPIKPAYYTGQAGYDLYIFDSYSPAELPKTGAVWFYNPVGNVDKSGFTIQGTEEPGMAGILEANTSSAPAVQNILKGVMDSGSELVVAKYVKCGTYRVFTTLLSHDNNPLVFTGTNGYNNRTTVFAFDLHDSITPLAINYAILTRNLLNYTFPNTIDNVSYSCGDVMEVNSVTKSDSIIVKSPSGKETYLDASAQVNTYQLTEAGVYSLILKAGDTQKEISVYCAIPADERLTSVSEQAFIITGEAGNEKRNGIFDDLLFVFIILAVLAMADWMVYCYEQYQLR